MDEPVTQLDVLLSEDLSSVYQREQHAFDDLLASVNSRIVLFGSGNLGRKVLRLLRSVGIEPVAFADNSESLWGKQMEGLSVLSPSQAAERFGFSAVFMVTIWSSGNSYCTIRDQLHAMGCTRVISTSEFRWKFAEHMLPDYCLDLPHKLYEQAEPVREAAKLWADEASRKTYLNHITWLASGDFAALEAPYAEPSYFIESLYQLQAGEVFVDCGAYDGDTVRQFLQHAATFSRVIAIEADPANFDKLQHSVALLNEDLCRRISCYKLAVGARRERLHFNATGAEGARVAEHGSVTVDCISLDELLEDSLPTMIKMDVEGSEIDALYGARKTIEKYQPILCICAYHRQDDIWRIPLLIHLLCSTYHVFLRSHDVHGLQLVCYAIPSGRLR